MTMRIPLGAALTAGAAALALEAACLEVPRWMSPAWAQAPQPEQKSPRPGGPDREYPYLPVNYAEVYLPSVAEWQALRLTALGASTTRLTSEFSRQHLTCFATPQGLVMTLDLLPRSGWKFYAGSGKFTVPAEKIKPDLQKAIDATMRFVRNFFMEVQDKDLSIRLFINSEGVGVWEHSRLTLYDEKK